MISDIIQGMFFINQLIFNKTVTMAHPFRLIYIYIYIDALESYPGFLLGMYTGHVNLNKSFSLIFNKHRHTNM